MKKIYLLAAALVAGTLSTSAQQIWDNFEDIRYGEYTFAEGPLIPYSGNPDPSGANTSDIVATYTRTNNAFDAILLVNNNSDNISDNYTEDVIPYVSGAKTITMDVWSPNAGTEILLVLQNSVLAQGAFPAGRHSDYRTTTTVAGGWETVEFEFDQIVAGSGTTSTQVDAIAILFSPATDNQDTYYFDNISGPEFLNDPCEDVSEDISVFNDFECQQNVNFFFSTAGINFVKERNPDPSGNPSSYVARYARNGNAADGNDVIQGDFSAPLQLSATSTITMDVWAPASGTTVRLALQNGIGEEIIPVDAVTSTSEEWETLTFDVSPVFQATDIEKFVILFNPGADTFEQYFFDNFQGTGILSDTDKEFVTDMKVFPNPASDMATLEYNLIASGDVNITLTDITGRVIENRIFQNQPNGTFRMDFNTGSYADGIYLFNVNVSGQNHAGKIIVNN
ncbi:MAG: T9SS type A sorting domain-containing protein [Cryomorphaceae bacterium]